MVHRRLPLAVIAALCAACLPASAFANGGASADDALAAEPAPAASSPAGTLAIGTPPAVATANGITIRSRSTALLKQRLYVSGVAPARLRELRIEQLDAKRGWTAVATATVAADGRYKAAWRPRAVGPQQLRAVAATTAARAGDAPQVGLTVYRPSVASWYGPGFYGGRTACGVKLRAATLGVAHKTLPCGTQVSLLYRGKTLVVPVIDRGPFVAGRTWDVTKATHGALGATDGLTTLGALPLRDRPVVRTPYAAPPIKR